MRTLKEFNQFIEKTDPISPSTDDWKLIRDYFGIENLEFNIESHFVTNQNYVVVKGRISISLNREPEKKKASEEDSSESMKRYDNYVEVAADGVGIVNLSKPFTAAVAVATRRARHHALGQMGFSIVPDEGESDEVRGQYWKNNDNSASSIASKASSIKGKKKDEDEEEEEKESAGGLECGDCEEPIKSFTSKAGKFIAAKQLASMTEKQYGEALCQSCSAKRFIQERESGGAPKKKTFSRR